MLHASSYAPAKVPIHFNLAGEADGWGSFQTLCIAVTMPLLIVCAAGFLIDELACRYEQAKRYNFLALFDDALAAFLLGLFITNIQQISESSPNIKGGYFLGLDLATIALIAAAALEYFRKPRPQARPESQPSPQTSLSEEELRQIASGSRWLHWEIQDPLYLRLLMAAMLLGMPLLGYVSYGKVPFAISMLYYGCCIFPLVFYGGMKVSVTPERLSVSFGLFGVPFLRLPLAKIAKAEKIRFNPVMDFGGWGVRYSLKLKTLGFFLYGGEGVRIETATGKKYLIGSDEPGKLASLLQALLKSRSPS
jgi:hypothetical protein